MKKKRLIMMLAAVAAASAAMAQGNGQADTTRDRIFRSWHKTDLCNRCCNRPCRWNQGISEVQFGRPRHE